MTQGEEIVVLATAGSESEGLRIARGLVEARVAACVNLLPGVRSVYRWKAAIEEDQEVLLVIKSTLARFEELRSAVRALHSYETPEVVALPMAAIDEDYGAWLRTSLAPEGGNK